LRGRKKKRTKTLAGNILLIHLAESLFAEGTIILLPLYGSTVLVFSCEDTKFVEGFSGPL